MDRIERFTLREEPSQTLLRAEPVRWAVAKLVTTLAAKGVARVETKAQITIDVLEASGAEGQRLAGTAGIAPPHDAESFALLRSGDHIAAIGADVRGLVYAVRLPKTTGKAFVRNFAAV